MDEIDESPAGGAAPDFAASRRPAQRREARNRLLAAAVDYVAEHGMTDLSLRRLAAAINTSHPMLIYHFGSADDLAGVEEAGEYFIALWQQHAGRSATPPAPGRTSSRRGSGAHG